VSVGYVSVLSVVGVSVSDELYWLTVDWVVDPLDVGVKVVGDAVLFAVLFMHRYIQE
jgi:hypothetical protein